MDGGNPEMLGALCEGFVTRLVPPGVARTPLCGEAEKGVAKLYGYTVNWMPIQESSMKTISACAFAFNRLIPEGPDRMVVLTCLAGSLLMPFLL